MAFPTKDGPNSYIWKLKDVYNARLGDNWPTVFFYNTRAVFGGGFNPGPRSNVIEFFDTATTGNTSDFGDLTVARGVTASVSDAVTAQFGGGNDGNWSNVIDQVTLASTGNATDFGDLTLARRAGVASGNNRTRGVFMGGQIAPAGGGTNIIDFITMVSTGNATDFGDLVNARYRLGGTSNNTRALTFGGSVPGAQNNQIDFITIATTGNASDFGDIATALREKGAFADETRAVTFGGYTDTPSATYSNVLEYVTVASTGNTTDFGDLTVARGYVRGTSNLTRGVACGGKVPAGNSNVIDFVTIQSTGDATDFGDLLNTNYHGANVSGANGGLQASS